MPRLLERHRPKRVLCVGMFGFATATLLLGLTSRLPSAAAFALAASALRMAEGGLGAVCEVVVNALLITHNPVGEISTVMGRLMVVRSLGMRSRSKAGPALSEDSAPRAPLASLEAQPRPQQPQAAPLQLGSQRSLMKGGWKGGSK